MEVLLIETKQNYCADMGAWSIDFSILGDHNVLAPIAFHGFIHRKRRVIHHGVGLNSAHLVAEGLA